MSIYLVCSIPASSQNEGFGNGLFDAYQTKPKKKYQENKSQKNYQQWFQFLNEDLADPHVNEIPAHKEDQPQSSSLEPSATVSIGIETAPICNDFALSISIQTSVVTSSKRSRNKH